MDEPQTRIDRYEIQEVIGRGAMGVVYRALDPIIGRVVALKTIHRADEGLSPIRPESLVRFSREARAAGLLSHPNIVTVYDVGGSGDGSLSYIAMEFVEGRTLRQIVPPGARMAPEEALDVALQVARGLDYAHRRGIIHRDVKPANILIREDGLVKLADFGVALIESSDLTRTGQSVGSPSYIAPEVLQDQPCDARSDLYSLGVILYEVLAGAKPFQGETLAGLYHRVISLQPEPPSRSCPDLAGEWDSVVLKLLAKDPEQRYASAAYLIEDLRALETGKPLRHAQAFAEAPERGPDRGGEQVREGELDRVIEEGSSDTGSGRSLRPAHVPHHMKAVLALGAIAGFALVVTLSAALLRQAEGGPAVHSQQGTSVPAPVDLTVRLAHSLKAGRLRISMDDEPLMVEPFRGEKGRMRTQGSLSRRIEVPHGKHLFRITVEEEGGKRWTAATTRDLGEGAEATLFVEVRGFLKKDLDLTWY